MNKVLHVNIGGYPFTFNDDAYDYLNQYLDSLHQHFLDSEGYEDIMDDIESRLAELFKENLGQRPIVTIADINVAISIMGRPEDFGADPLEEQSRSDNQKSDSQYGHTIRTGKRLFRDPDQKIVGGVCSGIAAYLGITDPIWIRLIWATFVIFGGVGFLLYVLLWALVPEAKTTADRLAMKGEPINIDSISRLVKDGLKDIENEFENISDNLGKKKDLNEKEDSEDIKEFKEVLRKGLRFAIRKIRVIRRKLGKAPKNHKKPPTAQGFCSESW